MLILFFNRLYCSSFNQIKMLNLSTTCKWKKSRAFSCLTLVWFGEGQLPKKQKYLFHLKQAWSLVEYPLLRGKKGEKEERRIKGKNKRKGENMYLFHYSGEEGRGMDLLATFTVYNNTLNWHSNQGAISICYVYVCIFHLA